jgi:hypothetical protein
VEVSFLGQEKVEEVRVLQEKQYPVLMEVSVEFPFPWAVGLLVWLRERALLQALFLNSRIRKKEQRCI